MEQKQANPFIDERSYLERRQDEIEHGLELDEQERHEAQFAGLLDEGGEFPL